MAYQIYEFHLSCNPVQLETGEWVSGGFTGKIRGQGEIPPEVKNAVFTRDDAGSFQVNNKFSIRDNHPPKDKKTALIARDLGNYCVLAVFNRIKDNIKREFVGEQFFWLSKPELLNSFSQDYSHSISLNDIDGIATLLYFWEYNKRPSYHVDIDSNPLRLEYRFNDICIKKEVIKKYSSRVDELLQKFKSEPNPRISDIEPDDIHCLALDANFRSARQLAWAWNVRKVEAQDFTAIYYADTNILQYSPPQQKAEEQNALLASSTSNQHHIAEQETNPIAEDIRRCLFDISNTKMNLQHVIKLLSYYREHQQDLTKYCQKSQVKEFVNNLEDNPVDGAIRHVALLVAIAPEKEQKLGKGLLALNLNRKQIAIRFLDELEINLDNLEKANPICSSDPCFNNLYKKVTKLNKKLERSIPKINEERLPSFFDLFSGSSSHRSNQRRQRKPTLPTSQPRLTANQSDEIGDPTPLFIFSILIGVLIAAIGFVFLPEIKQLLNIDKNSQPPIENSSNNPPVQQSSEQQLEKSTNNQISDRNLLKEYEKLEAAEMAFPEVKELAVASQKIRQKQLIPSLEKLVTQLQDQNPDTNDPIYKELQIILPKYDPNKLRVFKLDETNTEVGIIQKALYRGGYYQNINSGIEPPDYSKFDLATQETIKRLLKKDPFTEQPLTVNNWKQALSEIDKFIVYERVERIINYLLITLRSGQKYSKFQKPVKDCKLQAKNADQPLIFDSCMEKTLSKGK
ncbi:hypothetical protein [Nostoc sp. DedQUE07]|uniref:hypothetical protein n=1 Tax=Nostoc sp. DedQUE07 TaxID=3075392 RepID=UPI00391D0B9F